MSPARARGIRGAGPPGADGVLRRRHADAAARPTTSSRMLGAVRDEFGLARRRRGHHRGEPRLGRPRRPRCARRGRLHARLVRHAVGGAARARRARPHARPRARAARRRLGARRRTRREPRPHLRHAGGVDRRLAAQPRARPSPSSPTTSARTRSSSRTARSSPGRSGAASSPQPDDDLEADMYELADELLGAAGYDWYEVSNWATDDAHRSRHNLGYWRGDDWWGVGPGAHSHVGGVRWWNAKHPSAYADRVTGRRLARGRPRDARRARPARSSGYCCSRASARASPIASLHAGGRHAVAGPDRRRARRRESRPRRSC